MPPGNSKTFEDVLAEIRSQADSMRDLGDRFEKITKDFLVTDIQYKKRFKKVHLWKDWKYRYEISSGGGDIGVDLIGEEKDGSLCAIQCKCYADDGSLDYKKLSTFFATTELIHKKRKVRVNSILVYTGDRTTPNADKAIQTNVCHVLGQDEFRESSVIWDDFPKLKTKTPKKLRPHQRKAFSDVIEGMKLHDRGKMIMACGTGKTLTALHIAEKHVGVKGTVLYLVPSISLIHQTMREWSENNNIPHYYSVVCSDKTVGDAEDGDVSQLAFPPTTDVTKLKEAFGKRPKDAMGVIFSTYQSIKVVSEAIDDSFDLILCDEAHRTTGAEKEGADPAHFTLVHDGEFLKAENRVYMTATPRVYGEAVRDKANVHSMDDESIYGIEFHNYSFGDAVNDGQLADFKVRIPVVSEKDLKYFTDESIDGKSDEDGTIDERVLLAAVWHGLNYDNEKKQPLLQRVISFSNKIQASKQFSGTYKGDASTTDEELYAKSKEKKEDEGRIVADRSFENTVSKYEKNSKQKTGNTVSVRHIDGGMRASIRNNKLRWLKDSGQDTRECRILSNARCLSEGIDVPALDGVVFLQPRKSKTDVVQSVGRVMRISPGKEYGYVILPVVVPMGMTIEQSIHDNKSWKTVWQVLSALRSHNPNFANEINRINLDRGQGGNPPQLENVEIVWMGSHHTLEGEHELFGKLATRMVEKIGDRSYFDDRAKELGRKARDLCDLMELSYNNDKKTMKDTVDDLRDSLREIVNDSIDHHATVEVLSQHHALKQAFDALFPVQFRSANPIASSLDKAVSRIGLKKELESFESFFEEIRVEASKFKNDDGRQNYIKKIYENFMYGFDKKKQESQGIVYTPDEVIDFIIHSVQHVLMENFGKGLDSRDVTVLDPFTGTGAFVARLLESGILRRNLKEKYMRGIWANENSLLAYYVASINIEYTYQKIAKSTEHIPFNNINFTDTLNQHPKWRQNVEYRRKTITLDGGMETARENIKREDWSHIHVIIGNPPYSAAQKDYGDNNPNPKYPSLDERIAETYGKRTPTNRKDKIRDSYIRALRWASDRIGESGIIAFVTNASFMHSDTMAGVRACFEEEFNEIWCFDLRGDQRTKGEVSRKEGGKIFGSGSRTPVAITILVKKPKKKDEKRECVIRYKDIGDYLTREQKLETIQNFRTVQGIKNWDIIKTDSYHDWHNQRVLRFFDYTVIGMKNSENGIFRTHTVGIATGRDIWMYNSSIETLSKNMRMHIDYCVNQNLKNPIFDPKKGKWDQGLSRRLKKSKPKFDKNKIRKCLYRPFFTQYTYFDKIFHSGGHRIQILFPEKDSKNLVICIPDNGKVGMFSAIVTDMIPDYHIIEQSPCFPLCVYENGQDKKPNITEFALQEYRDHYKDKTITKEDIFYYVYALFHHPQYKEKFANNLAHELPHIPMAPDFWGFTKMGKKLADLHLNFDECERHSLGEPKVKFTKFSKLSFGKKEIKENGKTKKVIDKTKLCIDGVDVFDNIPEVKYQVNGRTPLEWIIDRYKITTDKESGITNDPCTGTDIIGIIERAIFVGLASDKLIDDLPEEFEPEEGWKPAETGLDKYRD